MTNIYKESIEKVEQGSRFSVNFIEHSLKIDGKYIIKNGQFDGCLGIEPSDFSLAEIERLYHRYNHSIPSARSDNKRRNYFRALPEHEFELYLAIEDIDHSKIKAKSPQTNGICERFNRTVQNEFYAIAFRKKIYTSIEQLQADLDAWMNHYNTERTHSGKYCFGKTPMQTFIEGIAVARRYDIQHQGLHSQEGETQNISTSCATEPKSLNLSTQSDNFFSVK